MQLRIGFNHINNLKDFGRQTPKDLKSFEVKFSEDTDYRVDAINIGNAVISEAENFKGQWELYIETDKGFSVTPFCSDDLKQTGKFDKLQESSSKVPNAICETIYDSILTGFGKKSKYL
jgi:hypothetical protein